MAFILNVTYTMKPGLRAEFLREVSEHGIQKAVLAEEGCLQYQYFEAVDEPDKLLLVERWTERTAQEVHMTQPHMVPLKGDQGSAAWQTAWWRNLMPDPR